jgi:DNA-binding protein H-NS
MTQKTYPELLKEQAALQAQIEQVLAAEKQGIIEKIREYMADYGITILEIEGRKRPFKPRGPRKPKSE